MAPMSHHGGSVRKSPATTTPATLAELDVYGTMRAPSTGHTASTEITVTTAKSVDAAVVAALPKT